MDDCDGLTLKCTASKHGIGAKVIEALETEAS